MRRIVVAFSGGSGPIHDERNLAATLAGGTLRTHRMLIAPCSIRTLSAVASSQNDTLVSRAADVHLKERRTLVLMVRETPSTTGTCG